MGQGMEDKAMSKKTKQELNVSLAERYVSFIGKLTDLTGVFAAYLLVPLVIVFLIEIIARNVFNSPTTWAYGTCFIIGGIAAVLGFAYAMKHGSMVRIDIIHSKLKEKTKCILDLVLYAVLFLPLTVGGSVQCVSQAAISVGMLETISSGSWNAPIWPTKIAMAYALILLTLQGIAEIVMLVKRLKEMKQEEKA